MPSSVSSSAVVAVAGLRGLIGVSRKAFESRISELGRLRFRLRSSHSASCERMYTTASGPNAARIPRARHA